MVEECVVSENKRYWFFSDALIVAISFVHQFKANYLAFDSNKTQDFDGKFQLFKQNMQK